MHSLNIGPQLILLIKVVCLAVMIKIWVNKYNLCLIYCDHFFSSWIEKRTGNNDLLILIDGELYSPDGESRKQGASEKGLGGRHDF